MEQELNKIDIENIISKCKWVFAQTYAYSNPHEYTVKEKYSNVCDFDLLCEYIKRNGHIEYFFGHKGIYCQIGDYTYWAMGSVVNRRWNDMYDVDDKGNITKVEDWRRLLKDGRILHK